MIGFAFGIGLLLYVLVPYIRSLKGTPGGRALLIVGAVAIAAAMLRRAGDLSSVVWALAFLGYFTFGGVAYAWETWRDGAADRSARAKSAAMAPQRMRRPLPPAAPSPRALPPGGSGTTGGAP